MVGPGPDHCCSWSTPKVDLVPTRVGCVLQFSFLRLVWERVRVLLHRSSARSWISNSYLDVLSDFSIIQVINFLLFQFLFPSLYNLPLITHPRMVYSLVLPWCVRAICLYLTLYNHALHFLIHALQFLIIPLLREARLFISETELWDKFLSTRNAPLHRLILFCLFPLLTQITMYLYVEKFMKLKEIFKKQSKILWIEYKSDVHL